MALTGKQKARIEAAGIEAGIRCDFFVVGYCVPVSSLQNFATIFTNDTLTSYS